MNLKLFLSLAIAILPIQGIAQSDFLPDSLRHAPDSVKTWTLREIGDSLIFAGQITTAKQAFVQALAIAQKSGQPADIGLGYRGMGYWHSNVGEYDQAVTWYQKALHQFEQQHRTRQYIKTLSYIIFCYTRLHQDKQALYYIKKGISMANKEGYTDLLIAFYNGYAVYADQHKQFKEALQYRKKILTYWKEKKAWQEYYISLFNMGLLYKNMKEYHRSEQAFRETLAYTQRVHDTYLQGYVLAGIPYALIPLGKLDEAENFCQQAIDWIDKTNTEKHALLVDINDHLGRIEEKRGNFQKALMYYRRQVVHKDSVFNAEKIKQVNELEARYQNREKEEQIRQLAETNARQTRQIWIGSGGVTILLILLGTLYHLYRRIGQSRQKIRQQSEQLTLMMKELHHRVKNNLAIVSSLLSLQATHLKDENALEAVRVSHQRVEAMSLIHQRLYQTEEVTTIDMQAYLTDLTHGLMKAYGYQPTEFDLHLDIQVINLDVDVATPIGLIANELITNSFKHAFPGIPHPRLVIKLDSIPGATLPGVTLEVHDNGPGIETCNWQKLDRRSSFGKQLVVMLTDQMEGKLELFQQNGALFRLSVPQTRLSA
ncbi:histidine kinase dimerization/phosphoacceptor domain -containing protein [Larkinella arboricola]